MRRLRPPSGHRAPAQRLTDLRVENAALRAENQRLRVTIAVTRWAHRDPPLQQVPAQRGAGPGEMGARGMRARQGGHL